MVCLHGRAQAFPNACYVLPLYFAKDKDILIKQSNILLKQSINIIDYVCSIIFIITINVQKPLYRVYMHILNN